MILDDEEREILRQLVDHAEPMDALDKRKIDETETDYQKRIARGVEVIERLRRTLRQRQTDWTAEDAINTVLHPPEAAR